MNPRRSAARRTTRLAGVACATCVLVLASCSATNQGTDASGGPPASDGGHPVERDAGPARPGGLLTVGISAETDSFNPFSGQWSIPSYDVANAVFEPLAAVDDLGIAHPYLAQSITPSDNFKAWTITVRPGIVFHDGEAFDGAALKKNLDKAMTSGLTAQVFAAVSSAEVVSDLGVRVTMTRPWATFPATLAMQAGYMAAPAMLDDPAGANATPIGTGPFAVQERVRDQHVKTRKNPSYWRKDANGNQLPYLDGIDFKVIPDAAARGNALAAGDVNAIDTATPDLLRSQLESAGQGQVQILTGDGKETDETVLALNTSREPFDDPIARLALAYAIDQAKLSATAYQGTFHGAWGMFEEGSPYYVPKSEVGYPEPDPARARALAEQYEQAHGKPLEFSSLLPPDPQYLAIGQALQEQLASSGIKANLQAVEQTQLIRNVIVAGDFQASGFLLRSAPSPDQSYVFLATKANPTGLSLNFSRLDDAELTAAMERFRAAAEPADRVAALKQVQQRLAANLPMIFLAHVRTGFVYGNDVHDLRATTYPDTGKTAFSPYPNTPFYTSAWKEQAG